MTRILIALALLAPVTAQGQWTRHTIDASSRGADGARLADANSDGHLDVVTGWEEGGEVRAYYHPGPERVREPWPRVTVGRVADPEDAVFVDIDRDGAVDIVSSCEGSTRTMFVHWAPRDPDLLLEDDAWVTEFIPASRNARQWMFCLPLDMDGDGDTDLVAGSKNEDAGVGWFECPSDPRDLGAWGWRPLYTGGWIMSLAAADLNGDGATDVLVSDRRGGHPGVLWLENPAGTDGDWAVRRVGRPRSEQFMFLTARERGDDRWEIVCALSERQLVRYRGGNTPWEETAFPFPDGTGRGKSVAVADLDEDGTDELIISCEHASDLMGLFAISGGSVLDIGGKTGTKFDLIQIHDVDGDGDQDILTTEEAESLGVIWYENPLR